MIAHGRFSGHGRPAAWVAADIVRIEDGRLAEHWDVLQDEATEGNRSAACRCSGTGSPTDLLDCLAYGAMRITGPGIWDVSQEAHSRSYQT